MKQTSTEDLVLATLGGDKRAFGELADRYSERAQWVALRMVRDGDLAKELVQEALLQAYLSLSTLRQPAHFAAWFMRIVQNVCHLHLRTHSTRDFSVNWSDDAGWLLTDSLGDPFTLLERLEEADLIERAIQSLSPKNQIATWLYYFESMSVEEIAHRLNTSSNVVKGRLFQARKQLRSELAPRLAAQTNRANSQSERNKRKEKMSKISTIKVMPGASDSQILYLLDTEGLRYLRIWIGPFEADQIRMQLEGKSYARPLTLRFFADFLTTMAIQLDAVHVARLHENMYYAVSHFRSGKRVKEVDTRPSDAIGLALHTGSPIFVDDEIMTQQGKALPDPLDVEAWFAAEMAGISDEVREIAAWQTEFYNTLESRFSQQAHSALQHAIALARHILSGYLETEHLLWGLATNQEGAAAKLLHQANVTRATITQAVEARFGGQMFLDEKGEFITVFAETVITNQPLVAHVMQVIKSADKLKEEYSAAQISAEHLLLAILHTKRGMAVTLLQELKVDLGALGQQVVEILDSGM